MIQESFRVYIHPMSINAFYTGNRQFKSVAAKEWTLEALHQLNQPSILEKMKNLREFFESSEHTYHIELKAAYPADKFKNKKGEISAKTIDITNFEKSLVDILFLPKFFDEFENLNVDDRFLTRMISEKCESENDKYYIDVTISIAYL